MEADFLGRQRCIRRVSERGAKGLLTAKFISIGRPRKNTHICGCDDCHPSMGYRAAFLFLSFLVSLSEYIRLHLYCIGSFSESESLNPFSLVMTRLVCQYPLVLLSQRTTNVKLRYAPTHSNQATGLEF